MVKFCFVKMSLRLIYLDLETTGNNFIKKNDLKGVNLLHLKIITSSS